MTTRTHTPGPWTLQAGRSIVTSSGSFYLSYGTEKGSGKPLFRDFCELDRNAQLCAAAPDLLAALQDAEFLLRKAGQLAGPRQDSFNRSAADARAAILNATSTGGISC
jgi:hypothetical protein